MREWLHGFDETSEIREQRQQMQQMQTTPEACEGEQREDAVNDEWEGKCYKCRMRQEHICRLSNTAKTGKMLYLYCLTQI